MDKVKGKSNWMRRSGLDMANYRNEHYYLTKCVGCGEGIYKSRSPVYDSNQKEIICEDCTEAIKLNKARKKLVWLK